MAHPGRGTGSAETAGTSPRSRSAPHRARTRPGDPGSAAPSPGSAPCPGTRTDALRTRGSSCGTSLDVAHAHGVLVQLPLQRLPGPEEPRLHGAHGYAQDLADLLVAHPFDVAQNQGFPERFRELINGFEHLVVDDLVEEGPLGVVVLYISKHRVGLDSVHVHGFGVPGAAAVFINKGIAEDREQPPLGIGPLLVLIPGAIRLEHGLLDQVVGVGGIAGQAQGDPVEGVEVHQGFLLEARPLLIDRGGRRGGGGHTSLKADGGTRVPQWVLGFPGRWNGARFRAPWSTASSPSLSSKRSATSIPPSTTGSPRSRTSFWSSGWASPAPWPCSLSNTRRWCAGTPGSTPRSSRPCCAWWGGGRTRTSCSPTRGAAPRGARCGGSPWCPGSRRTWPRTRSATRSRGGPPAPCWAGDVAPSSKCRARACATPWP